MIKRRRSFGLSFSWRRATGLSSAKARLSRRIGIPLTRAGRRRKLASKLGCCIPLTLAAIAAGAAAAAAAQLLP